MWHKIVESEESPVFGWWEVYGDSCSSQVASSYYGIIYGFVDEIAFGLPSHQKLSFNRKIHHCGKQSMFYRFPMVNTKPVVINMNVDAFRRMDYLQIAAIASSWFASRPVTVEEDGHYCSFKLSPQPKHGD